jgi:YVTN family beta-propeller protein
MKKTLAIMILALFCGSCGSDGSGDGSDTLEPIWATDTRHQNPGNPPDGDSLGEADEAMPIPECEADEDGDGFGDGCFLGPDCDEGNPKLNVYCPPCDYGIYEGCPCSNLGNIIDCYPEDPIYLGVGECTAGQQQCDDGYWGPCVGAVEPVAEVCDYLDNDCDGETDEGVLNPCGDCSQTCNSLGAGPGEEYPFQLDQDNSSGVSENVDGFIVLDSQSLNIEYIWIANSAENTVSKIHTKTGKEEGRYYVCSNPSRTAVDLYGDVWVGCRNDGGVGKILVHELFCEDLDGDGTVETSKDANGDGKISGDEMMPNGEDECLKFVVNPGGSCQRGLGVDKQNHAWVGEWNGKMLRRLHPEDGAVVQEIAIPANPYGLVIDKNGVIWVSGRGGSLLVRADPATGNVQSFSPGSCFNPYGIALDYKGRVWTANNGCESVAWRYDPLAGAFDKVGMGSNPRGLVGSQDGRVYVANDGDNKVVVVNSDNLSTIGTVNLGGGRFPLGMAIDFDGYVWAVNQSASSTSKIDPAGLNVIGEFPTGSGPYTYSDMTGYMLHSFTNPSGYYRHSFGGWGLRVRWTGLIVDAYLPGGSYLKVRVRSANSEEELEQTPWSESFGPFPPATFPFDMLPLDLYGHYLEVEVSLYANEEGTSPLIKGIEIQFDNGQGGTP